MTGYRSKGRLAALLWLLCCCAALLAGCGGGQPAAEMSAVSSASGSSGGEAEPSSPAMGSVYTDAAERFQITVPEGWTEQAGQSSGDYALFVSPSGARALELETQEADCNLLAYSAAEFTAAYQEALEDFQLQSLSTVTANGSTGVALRYTCTRDGTAYTAAQYVMAGAYDYNITFFAVDSDADFLALAEDSIATFRELDPENDPVALEDRLVGQTYRDGANGYAITLPEGWRVASQEKDCVAFQSGDGGSDINVQCGALDEKLFSYQQEAFLESFQQMFGASVQITAFSTVELDGTAALYLECSYSYDGKALVSQQYSLNGAGATYRITFTSASAEAGETDFAKVASSFTMADAK